MYFHCILRKRGATGGGDPYAQQTLLGTSDDGLRFEVTGEPLGSASFRVFRWRGATYALDKQRLYRSSDGTSRFERGPALLPDGSRHAAVHIDAPAKQLLVLFSREGDAPEHILATTVDLTRPWLEWRATEPVSLLKPETSWEGAELPNLPSKGGIAREPVRQLRDPAIYAEGDELYLLYSVAGESGIAIARLHPR